MKIIVVTGSRNWAEKRTIYKDLTREVPGLIIHGDARGADNWAEGWAVENSVVTLKVGAKWKLGAIAGPRRNAMMVVVARALDRAGHEVKVLAYPLGASKGTRGMMRLCVEAGLNVEDRTETNE